MHPLWKLGFAAVSVMTAASPAMSLPTVIRGIPTPTVSETEPVYVTGPSDADFIFILSGLPNGRPGFENNNWFWWDHPNLTVAIRDSENSDPVKVQAIRDGIEIWRSTLAERFRKSL